MDLIDYGKIKFKIILQNKRNVFIDGCHSLKELNPKNPETHGS